MARIRVLRPDVDEPARAPFEPAPRRELPEQPVIGLIANGKPLAKELLSVFADELGTRIGRRFAVELLEKPSAAYQISAEEAGAFAVRSHLVITGLGD